jgi:ABC-type nitrate/sulfonate/bicarbonate transport system substrate-binding protein
VRKTLAARAEGIEVVAERPEEVAEAWAEEAGIKPSSALRALESVDPHVHWTVGLGKPEGLEAVLETMRLIDLLGNHQEVDWDELVDQRFIPEADRAPLPETN